jgi:tRNA U55 pseudouridine synthase TruB
VADATSIDQLAEDPDSLCQRVLTPAAGLADLGAVMIDDALAERVAHGAVLDPTEVAIADTMALVDGAGRLLAVYRQDGDRLKPEVVLS